MADPRPFTSYEQEMLDRRGTIIIEWLGQPTKRGLDNLRLLAYCDEVAAYHVLQAFQNPNWADELGTTLLFTVSTYPYRPYFWRVIGAVLEWMGDLEEARAKVRIDPAIPEIFLGRVASANSNLTGSERQLLAQRIMEYGLYNLLGNHGILEGIPFLLDTVTTLPDGTKQTQEAALVNGYEPVLIYNLLRLQAIKESRERKAAEKAVPAA